MSRIHGVLRRLVVAGLGGAAAGVMAVLWTAGAAGAADDQIEVGQASPAPITLSVNEPNTASPYPSEIAVSGLGAIERVEVWFGSTSHSYPDDLDIVLESPSGVSVMLLSDAGGNVPVAQGGFVISDQGGGPAPDSGELNNIYQPTNHGAGDVLPAPAPSSYRPQLVDLVRTDPNGTWKLWVYDDAPGDGGAISQWALRITAPIEVTSPQSGTGAGTLGAAILRANAASGRQTISFDIPGAGPHAIAPSRKLPTITGPVTIDGFTQPGSVANIATTGGTNAVHKISLNGWSVDGFSNDPGSDRVGIDIAASNTTIRGLAFDSWASAVAIRVGGSSVTGVKIVGCTIGAREVNSRNDVGILLRSGATATIGGTVVADRNLLSGNDEAVMVTEDALATVLGNLIGVDATGKAVQRNTYGVRVTAGRVQIGGAVAGARNVISGNAIGAHFEGVVSAPNVVEGNYVGLGADGSTVVANQIGISTDPGASLVIVGGRTIGARNVISGNTVGINGGYMLVLGNHIGTTPSGASARGNGTGISAGPGMRIGDFFSASRNVISGNTGWGVSLTTAAGGSYGVADAYIGVNAAGTAALPNGAGGVLVSGSFSYSSGQDGFHRNVIGGNRGPGIEIVDGSGTGGPAIYGNHIGITPANVVVGNAGPGARLAWVNGGRIGGPGTYKNVISGNEGPGILIEGKPSSGHETVGICANLIGTTVNASSPVPNGQGIVLRAGADGVTIGGDDYGDAVKDGIVPCANVVSGNDGEGVLLDGVHRTVVAGNRIGVRSTGTAANPNLVGIRVTGGSTGTQIGTVQPASGNQVAGNVDAGIVIDGSGTDGTVLRQNLVGLSKDGLAPIPNGGDGVQVLDGARGTRIGGRTAATDRNVISANGGSGVFVAGSATTLTTIEGSFVGTTVNGNVDLGNAADGVTIAGAPGNTVGGTSSTAGNVISGNDRNGVALTGPGTAGNRVYGNLIGLTANGAARLGNAAAGVEVSEGATNSYVGTGGGGRNVISANGADGVWVDGSTTLGSRIQGNVIGTNAAATATTLGNVGHGVAVSGGARTTTVGGTTSGQGNRIRSNGGSGVQVSEGAARTAIRGNELTGNGRLGIDLVGGTEDANGVTANDVKDVDGGANGLQNAPVVTSAALVNGSTVVAGTLNSVPSATFTVEVFRSPAGETPAEAVTKVGAVTVTTDANGNATWSVPVGSAISGQVVTALAQRSQGDTSELSSGVTAA